MVEYDLIDISEGINISIKNASKECDICLDWYFLDKSFKCELYLRNGCHDLMQYAMNFNPIQDGGQKSSPPTSFSPVTSTNVGFDPKIFLTFSFNPFPTLVQNFKFVSSPSPKLLDLNQDHPSKKAIFLVESL